MKVLYLVSAYPRTAGDVITPWLVETIHRLGERGIEVEVLAPSYRGLRTQYMAGVKVHRFRYAPAAWETLTHDQTAPDRIREKPRYLSLVPAYVAAGSLAAARIARSGGFAALHAFWPLPHGLLGAAARKISGVPLVCTFFGVELTWMESELSFLRPLLRWMLAQADGVTAISSYTAAKLRKVLPSCDPLIIPFGAAVHGRRRATTALVKPPRTPCEVLFVGRLVERKGIPYLLEAVAQLRVSHPLHLRVVGEGPLRAWLEARAAELGLGDVVSFEGLLPQPELERRFAECDLFVLPAVVDAKGDTEGLGVVLIEALSYGKPVVASAVGGIPDIVRHEETGLLVPPSDASALAGALARMIQEPENAQRLAAAGQAHVEREFSWTTITERLELLYRRLAQHAAGNR